MHRSSGLMSAAAISVIVCAGLARAANDHAQDGQGHGQSQGNEQAQQGPQHELPQAHTTPSGVTTAQPGGGNPHAASDNAATPASRAGGHPSPAGTPASPPGGPGGQPNAAPSAVPRTPGGPGAQPNALPPSAVAPGPDFAGRRDAPPSAAPAAAGWQEPLPPAWAQPAPVAPPPGLPPVRFVDAPLVAGDDGPRVAPLRDCVDRAAAAFTPDGRWLLVCVPPEGAVDVISAERRELVTRLRVGQRPREIVVAAGGRTAYAACHDGVAEISLARLGDVHWLPFGQGPTTLALTPSGKELLVASEAGSLVVVDTRTRRRSTPQPIGAGPHDVEVTSDGRTAFVVNAQGATVSVLDLPALQLAATLPLR